MKLFVYEYITSGALINEDLPQSLFHEGDAMLSAIVNDLSAIDDIQLYCMRDTRLPTLSKNITCKRITSKDAYLAVWQTYLEHCDYVLIIAPETENVLLSLSQQVPQTKFLGCSSDAISLCGNKYLTAQCLIDNRVNTAPTLMADSWIENITVYSDSPVVVKPNDGAGCVDTYIFSKEQAFSYLTGLASETREKCIVQPKVEGTAASVTCFIDEKVRILNINEQFLTLDHQQLVFQQCKNTPKINAMLNEEKARSLISTISEAIDGLWGFIGVDLIITTNELVVIEINPRLTTAYLDLKNHLDFNPATLLLEALTD
jgi:predicted ATP-grasp superfamily ATP-dependent carboligase